MAKPERKSRTRIQSTPTRAEINEKRGCEGSETWKENDNPSSPTPELFMQELASDTVKRSSSIPSGYIIDGRYAVLKRIGGGAFGNVYKVRMVEQGTTYAMKVIKSKHSITPSTLREIEILFHIARVDPEHKSLIVQLIEALSVHQHVCLVYELLGPTLMNVLMRNKRVGFPMKQVREITYQLVTAAAFLHLNGMIHHDIKPDNISFLHKDYELDEEGRKVMRSSDIRLIDFGSTVYSNQRNISTATTRQYRSPEMGLRYSWSCSCDVWSIGCTVFELYTGNLLFPCLDEIEKCYMMEAILDRPVPFEMGRVSSLPCFDKRGMLKYENFEMANQIQDRVKPLNEYQINPEDSDTRVLFDLLNKMLKIDPNRRISTDDILKHPFLAEMRSASN